MSLLVAEQLAQKPKLQATVALAREERARSLAELASYNAQLARVQEVWQRRPDDALALLKDARRCPPNLRDFTWGYYLRLLHPELGAG